MKRLSRWLLCSYDGSQRHHSAHFHAVGLAAVDLVAARAAAKAA